MTPARKARDPMLAKIHIAKKELGLEDDDYRMIIGRIAPGKRSSRDLTDRQRANLLDEFKTLGWGGRKAAVRSAGGKPPSPLHAKARALWWALHWLGEVDNPGDRALDAFAKRTAKVDALRWAGVGQANKIIEALKDWCARAGFEQPGDEDQKCIKNARELAGLDSGGAGMAARARLVCVLWDKLISAGAFKTGIHANLATWLHNQGWAVSAPHFLTPAQAMEAAKRLGTWYRRKVGKVV